MNKASNGDRLLSSRRLGVVDFTYTGDNGSAIRLRKLLGSAKTTRMAPHQHPWGMGFGALVKYEKGVEITDDEANALSNLNLDARMLFQMEKSWQPFKLRVADELSDAVKCESLIFELHTARVVCKGTSKKILWTSFYEGEPDLALKGPSIAVECKLLRSKQPKRLDVIARASEQHRDIGVPLVVSVGLSRELSDEEVCDVVNELPTWKNWFANHDRIAAGIVFSPIKLTEGQSFAGTLHQFGNVAVLRSTAAKHQLPDGFAFRGEDRRTEIAF